MNLDTFQKAYGQKYSKTVATPDLLAAVMLLRTQRRDYLLSLSDDQIQKNAVAILGRMVESVRYEVDLLTIHKKKTFTFNEDAPLEYVSPEEEAVAWSAIDTFRNNGKKARK